MRLGLQHSFGAEPLSLKSLRPQHLLQALELLSVVSVDRDPQGPLVAIADARPGCLLHARDEVRITLEALPAQCHDLRLLGLGLGHRSEHASRGPGGTPADPVAFEHGHSVPELQQLEGERQTDHAAAHDDRLTTARRRRHSRHLTHSRRARDACTAYNGSTGPLPCPTSSPCRNVSPRKRLASSIACTRPAPRASRVAIAAE